LRIPEEKIEEIRNTIDIVDLIGSIVRLKKRGKNYIGLCPFHTEKTPSFTVSSDKQMYHCFGCGVGGNSITFLMEYEKVSFIEAVRSLAERAGISLPTYAAESEDSAKEQEEFYNACRTAGLFFYHNLTETIEGKFALDYFRKRGFSNETIRVFGLGCSPRGWQELINYAASRNISAQTLEKVGLARKREDGSYFDFFRGRAIFPVFSSTGRTIAFGARKIYEDDQLGKYINSPETVIYNKSKILYGISHAKEAIREEDFAILVEGYVDLIRVYQEGIHNVVASSGTALTIEQIHLIGRYTKNITIVYDADSAGSKATLRGVDLILENDLDVRVAILPTGEDPDSFIGKYGSEKFNGLVRDGISFVDFITQSFEMAGYFKTPEGQTKAVRTIIQTIAKIKDEIKRNFFIKHVAEKYKLYESVLYKELEKCIRDIKRTDFRSGTGRELSSERPVISAENNSKQLIDANEKIPVAEKDLLHAIIDGGKEVADLVFRNFSPEDFTHPVARNLANKIKSISENGSNYNGQMILDSISALTGQFNNDYECMRRLMAELQFSKYELSKRWEEFGAEISRGDALQIAKDALKTVRRQSIQKLLETNQQLMKDAESKGEDLTRYLNRHTELLNEKASVDAGDLR
jgi:DNA primase